MAAGDMRRIAVLRPGALGDAILALPVLDALRSWAPGAELMVVGHPVFRLAVQGGLADRWLAFDDARLLPLFASDGKCDVLAGFDLCLAFVSGTADVLASALERSGVRRSVVWPSRPPRGVHVVDHLLGAAREAGAPTVDATPRLKVHEDWLARGRERLGDIGDFLAMHPGSGGRSKCWPLERFVEASRLVGLPVVWLLGPAEFERGGFEEVCGEVGRVVANPGLEELAGILALARGYLGNDSGVSHLAAALGVPTVAVFGPTDPREWGPRGERVRTLGGPGEGGFGAVTAGRVCSALTAVMDGG